MHIRGLPKGTLVEVKHISKYALCEVESTDGKVVMGVNGNCLDYLDFGKRASRLGVYLILRFIYYDIDCKLNCHFFINHS